MKQNIYYKSNKPKWNRFQDWNKWCDVSKVSARLAPKTKKSKPIKEFRQQQIDNANVYELKTKQILAEMGIRYEYQKVYGPYILDFYLPDFRVDLEMDGHYHKARRAKDKKRSKWLYSKRIWTIRFWNYVISKPEEFKESLKNRLSMYKPIEQERRLTWMDEEYKRVCQ